MHLQITHNKNLSDRQTGLKAESRYFLLFSVDDSAIVFIISLQYFAFVVVLHCIIWLFIINKT